MYSFADTTNIYASLLQAASEDVRTSFLREPASSMIAGRGSACGLALVLALLMCSPLSLTAYVIRTASSKSRCKPRCAACIPVLCTGSNCLAEFSSMCSTEMQSCVLQFAVQLLLPCTLSSDPVSTAHQKPSLLHVQQTQQHDCSMLTSPHYSRASCNCPVCLSDRLPALMNSCQTCELF